MKMESRLILFLSTLATISIFQVEIVTGRGISTNTFATVEDVSHLLEPIVAEYNAPALGGLFMNEFGTVRIAASGTRKRGSGVNVTTNDYWHLGSDTKAMTATLVARFVELGIVSWEDTVGNIFNDLDLLPEFYFVNFLHLLSHSSGIPRDADWKALSESAETVAEQRVNTVRALNDIVDPIPAPGTNTTYSNWGITVAAAMLERVTGQSYEELMPIYVFGPLDMDTAGYGPTSGPDELTQPWGHFPLRNTGIPAQLDIPPLLTPAGSVHCSLEDWGKFVLDHLRGELGFPGLLTLESYTRLHTAPFGGYALGWGIGTEDWAEGPTLEHTGMNGYNYAKVVIDPAGRVAALATCNQGSLFADGPMTVAGDEVLRVMATLE